MTLEPPPGVGIQLGPWYSSPPWRKVLLWLRWQAPSLLLLPYWTLLYQDRTSVAVMWRRNEWKMGKWKRWIPG